jgi:hypothetical protein
MVRSDLYIAVCRVIPSVFVWYASDKSFGGNAASISSVELSQVLKVAVYIFSYWIWIA